MGVIVVGYVPKPEGEAALRLAAEEAKAAAPASSSSTPTAAAASSTARTPSSPRRSSRRCAPSSRTPASSTRSASSSAALDPAEDLINVAERGLGRPHRDRPAPPLAGGQAHPRQQRAAHPARRAVPGARGQGCRVAATAENLVER